MASPDPGSIHLLGRRAVSVLNSVWFALPVGTVLGFLSGLGTGGGSLLILWLTLVLKVPQQEARLMNLMFFIPSAVIACLFRRKQGQLHFRKVLPGILAGCAAAGICAMLTGGETPEFLRRCFGILLIFTGIREIFYKERGR